MKVKANFKFSTNVTWDGRNTFIFVDEGDTLDLDEGLLDELEFQVPGGFSEAKAEKPKVEPKPEPEDDEIPPVAVEMKPAAKSKAKTRQVSKAAQS